MKENKENSWWDNVIDDLLYGNPWYRYVLITVFFGLLIWVTLMFIAPLIKNEIATAEFWNMRLIDMTSMQLLILFVICALIWHSFK